MLQGALFAATGGCASLIGEAAAQAALPVRRSVTDLPLNDPILEALREGVRRMKAAPATDPLRWAALSAIHGVGDVINRCAHGNWYFLPWHRAYLLMYERLIRNLTGFQQFALPYWDWTSNRQLPEAFAQATSGGRPNPLHEPSRTMQPLTEEVVGQRVMSEILGAAAFEQLGSVRPQGQNSTDPIWIGRRTGPAATLERTPHNIVHTRVGGLLRTAGSPLDPIFLMHHCNVDRIWAAWRAAGHEDSTEPLWLDMAFQNHFFNVDGSPFSPRVRDLLDPARLGYSYGTGTPTMSASPSVSALAGLVTQVLSGGQGPGIRVFRIAPSESVAAPAPFEATVALDRTLLGQVVRRPPVPTGMAVDLELRQELAARGTRALVILRNVDVGDGEELYYRVFVDCGYLSADTPITDSHYVSTFGFFAHGRHAGHGGHGGDRASILLDFTDALQRVHGNAPVVPGSIRVQVLPVTASGAAPAAADTTFSRVGNPVARIAVERIEVAFVSP
jgi:tyrosinase